MGGFYISVVGERRREKGTSVGKMGRAQERKREWGKERVWPGWKRGKKEWAREMAWTGMTFLFLFCFQK